MEEEIADEDIRELPCQTVMVFQCAKCLRVLTDSTEAVATCCSLQILAFKGRSGRVTLAIACQVPCHCMQVSSTAKCRCAECCHQ